MFMASSLVSLSKSVHAILEWVVENVNGKKGKCEKGKDQGAKPSLKIEA
jgi:hypothetical protein